MRDFLKFMSALFTGFSLYDLVETEAVSVNTIAVFAGAVLILCTTVIADALNGGDD